MLFVNILVSRCDLFWAVARGGLAGALGWAIGLPTTVVSMLPVFFPTTQGFFGSRYEPQLVFVGGRFQPVLGPNCVARCSPLKVVVYMNSRMAVSLMAAPEIKTIAGLKSSSRLSASVARARKRLKGLSR